MPAGPDPAFAPQTAAGVAHRSLQEIATCVSNGLASQTARHGQISKSCPALIRKIFPFPLDPNQLYNPSPSRPQRGGSRSSRTRGGMRWTRQRRRANGVAGRVLIGLVSVVRHADERRMLRTEKSCGPDAPTLASSLRRRAPAQPGRTRRQSAGDGGKQARSPGRARRKPLKPLRREGRVSRRTLGDYARVLHLNFAREAAGASGTRLSLRPLLSEGQKFMHNSDAWRRGDEGLRQRTVRDRHRPRRSLRRNVVLILRSLRSKRLEGWTHNVWTRGHPSRRAQRRAPQDEVGDLFHDLGGGRSSIPRRQRWNREAMRTAYPAGACHRARRRQAGAGMTAVCGAFFKN